jgi:hypothetical protein
MGEVEKRLKNGSDDSITLDTGSFFHYFEEEEDDFDVCPRINSVSRCLVLTPELDRTNDCRGGIR